MLPYRFLRTLLRLAVRIFYRRVEVVGLEHIPAPGKPVIFCGNHPNSLLDPIVITTTCGRIVHFAAKDVLFKHRIVRWLLKTMGAVPVQRRKDHVDGALDNESAFNALYGVLSEGRTMGIFPEGISHNESQLQGLKTGAARIAFGAKRSDPDADVVIIPCGLNYLARHRFRSSILVQYGTPIRLDAKRLEAYEEDSRAAVQALTEEIESHMRSLTINAEDWNTLRVLDGVRRLYQPERISLEERIELARRFNSVYPKVQDSPAVKDLFGKVSAFLERLEFAELTDRDVQRDMGALELAWRVSAHLLWLFVWLPLGVIGAVLHFPMALLLGWAGEKWAPRKDVVGTTKFILGFFSIQLAYGGLFALAGLYWSWSVAFLLLILTPISGYATLRVSERLAAVRRISTGYLKVVGLGKEIRALRHQRQMLKLAVEETVDRYRPADMAPLFPRDDVEDFC